MERRDFLKLAGLTGLSLMLPWTRSSSAQAAGENTWGGPYFLHMHAGGGWDPTMFCDGKLTAGGSTPVYENRLTTEVTKVGNIPVPSAASHPPPSPCHRPTRTSSSTATVSRTWTTII